MAMWPAVAPLNAARGMDVVATQMLCCVNLLSAWMARDAAMFDRYAPSPTLWFGSR